MHHVRPASAALLPALLLLAPNRASAQAVEAKLLLDARARYEWLDWAGLPRDAHALTGRLRPGVAVERDDWSAVVEAGGTVGIVDRCNDGFNGCTTRPTIPDADNLRINRAQVGYRSSAVAVTAGRQLLELADQRYVGPASFRRNQQTFDAVRAPWTPGRGAAADIGYARSVRTPTGRTGLGARPQSIGGDNASALVGYAALIRAIGLGATVHRFRSDRPVRHHGDERDLLAAARIARTTVAARPAGYRAATFGGDARRFRLSTEYRL